jgi:hypothetical protein
MAAFLAAMYFGLDVSVGSGQWAVVIGHWSLVSGQWSVVEEEKSHWSMTNDK